MISTIIINISLVMMLLKTHIIIGFNLFQLSRIQELICIIQYTSLHCLIFLIVHVTLTQMSLIQITVGHETITICDQMTLILNILSIID